MAAESLSEIDAISYESQMNKPPQVYVVSFLYGWAAEAAACWCELVIKSDQYMYTDNNMGH